MDVSDLRKQILRALDDARRDAAQRRTAVDEASAAWTHLLNTVAVPLVRQAAGVLRAEGHGFTVHTPADSVRLASDASPETFLEIQLDTHGSTPQVIGRISLGRGRQAVVVDERPLAQSRPVSDLVEEDFAGFLVDAIPRLIVNRSPGR